MTSPAPHPAILTENLTRCFARRPAVADLSLSIAPGEIFGLVGPDGAGKTTTLRLLCGLLRPTSGRAWLDGKDVSRDPSLKHSLGYMAQRFSLYADLTVAENMRFFSDLFPAPPASRDALSRRLLDITRLTPFLHRPAGQLSGGMKQKLSLLCTLLHQPKILLLDEPTAGVDPISRRDFWTILYELVPQGLTVLLTTSYLDEAERCHRVGLLSQGRLIACGAPRELCSTFPFPCFALSAPDLRRARLILLSAPGVLAAETSPNQLRLFLHPRHTSPAALETLLLAAGLSPVSLSPVTPTLEDVFIALVRHAAQESSS